MQRHFQTLLKPTLLFSPLPLTHCIWHHLKKLSSMHWISSLSQPPTISTRVDTGWRVRCEFLIHVRQPEEIKWMVQETHKPTEIVQIFAFAFSSLLEEYKWALFTSNSWRFDASAFSWVCYNWASPHGLCHILPFQGVHHKVGMLEKRALNCTVHWTTSCL